MAKYKRQHYVPQFLLKKFSEDSKLVNIFNISLKKNIHNVPLKKQCYEDYFYGKDGELEKSLGEMETEISSLISKISSTASLNFEIEEIVKLYLFICIQLARTKQASDSLNETSNKLFKAVFEQKAIEDKIDLTSFDLILNEAVKHSISFHLQHFPILLDLDIRLLINETSTDFILSDNPVVAYNKLLHFRKGVSNTGLATKGLKLYFPISSKKGLFLFDPSVYRVRTNKHKTLKVSSISDVHNLNSLQFCNSVENFYFLNPRFNSSALYNKNEEFIIKESSKINTLKTEENKSYIINTKVDIGINLKLKFLNFRPEAKAEQMRLKKSKVLPGLILRNEKLYYETEEKIKLEKEKHTKKEQC